MKRNKRIFIFCIAIASLHHHVSAMEIVCGEGKLEEVINHFDKSPDELVLKIASELTKYKQELEGDGNNKQALRDTLAFLSSCKRFWQMRIDLDEATKKELIKLKSRFALKQREKRMQKIEFDIKKHMLISQNTNYKYNPYKYVSLALILAVVWVSILLKGNITDWSNFSFSTLTLLGVVIYSEMASKSIRNYKDINNEIKDISWNLIFGEGISENDKIQEMAEAIGKCELQTQAGLCKFLKCVHLINGICSLGWGIGAGVQFADVDDGVDYTRGTVFSLACLAHIASPIGLFITGKRNKAKLNNIKKEFNQLTLAAEDV